MDAAGGDDAAMLHAVLASVVLRLSLIAPFGGVADLAAARVGDTAAPLVTDFEAMAKGTTPEAWSGGGGSGAAVDDSVAHGGRHSLRLQRAATGDATKGDRRTSSPSWTLPAEQLRGHALRLTLASRSSAADRPLGIRFEVERAGHAPTLQAEVSATTSDGAWALHTVEAAIALDATEVRLRFTLPSGAEDHAWIDDLRVERIGSLADVPYEWQLTSAEQLAAPTIKAFELRSPSLSAFWGRDITMHAAVVVPAGVDLTDAPVCYAVHGFGGNHLGAWRSGPELARAIEAGESPKILHVFLDASCPLGHHEFADSVNNGPWGAALTQELMPAIERQYGGERDAAKRFVRGHSSGGWCALWLQVTYPDRFGGCWASAPDPVDFRDFSGVDLFTATNIYRDEAGNARPLVMRGDEVAQTVEEYVRGELSVSDHGGQIASFDAVFSPRGPDGRPMPFFDRATGAIDQSVVNAWRRYDIGEILRTNWASLGPRLRGKIHVWCGDQDTFRLQGAVRLLQADLTRLGSDADILLVPGRDHGSLMRPHDELWPKGMIERQLRQMAGR